MKQTMLVSLGLAVMAQLPNYAFAADSNYKFCSIAGFAYGNQENFLGFLAVELTVRKGVAGSALCRAAHKAAYEIGERVGRTGVINAGDQEVVNQFNEFKNRISDAILRSAGY